MDTQADDERYVAAFATVLRRYRKASKISQEELAHRAGKSMRYISLLETRKHQPSILTVRALATSLEVPLLEFMAAIEQEYANGAR